MKLRLQSLCVASTMILSLSANWKRLRPVWPTTASILNWHAVKYCLCFQYFILSSKTGFHWIYLDIPLSRNYIKMICYIIHRDVIVCMTSKQNVIDYVWLAVQDTGYFCLQPENLKEVENWMNQHSSRKVKSLEMYTYFGLCLYIRHDTTPRWGYICNMTLQVSHIDLSLGIGDWDCMISR